MLQYDINKGINKPMEFKGFKGQYIAYLAAGLVLTFLLFACTYLLGIPMYACLTVSAVLGTAVFMSVSHLNAKYGEHGLMKKFAQRQVPETVVIRSRKIFTKLIH